MRRRAFASLLIVSGALLAAHPAHSAQAGRAGEAEAQRGEVSYLVERYGVSAAEAAYRIGLQEAIGELQVRAGDTWPDTFAGLWVDHTAGGAVFVAFTKHADRNVAALAASFVAPGRLRAVTFGQSRAQLERRKDRMVADRELARAGRLAFPGMSGAAYHLDLDVRRNAVVVMTERPSAATVAAFRARYGADVRVEHTPDAGPETCGIDSCRYSLRSGLKITEPSIGYCTSAFTTTGGGLFTAGHCNAFGFDFSHGGSVYGRTETFQQLGNTDAAAQFLTGANFYAGAWIRANATTTARPVTGTGLYTSMAVGNVVFKAGATTDETSGSVTSTNFSPSWVAISTQFIKTDYCAEGGDSGAGVYMGNTAVGIHSGGSSGACAPGQISAFGHIQFAQSTLGKTVKTSEGGPSFTAVTGAKQGVSTVTVRFSKPVVCSTVSTSDFSARLSNVVSVTNLTVTGVSGCSVDSISTMTLSLNPAPVFGTNLEVSIVGTIQDPGGSTVPFVTRSTPVSL